MVLSTEEIVEIAEQLLTKRFGGTQKLSGVEKLGGSGTSVVLRTRVASSPFLPQRTVILKYSPASGDLFDDSALIREIVSYQFTTSLSEDVRPGPVMLAYDVEKRILVLSDSGDGDTFADLLESRSEDTRLQILRNLGASLGGLHAATSDKEQDFNVLMSRMLAKFPATTKVQHLRDLSLHRAIDIGLKVVEANSIEIPEVVRDFAADAKRRLESGRLRAFTPFDLSPDNIIVAERTHFLDYEFAGFRDATFDVASVIAGFPQVIVSHPITDDEAAEFVDSWVQEVRGIWPNVNNETRLKARIVTALIAWSLYSVTLMQLGSVTSVVSLFSENNGGSVNLDIDDLLSEAPIRSDEESVLVKQDLRETVDALHRFANSGNDPRFPEVAQFALELINILGD